MKERLNGISLTYQIFIEPKGRYLQQTDKWKEDFLVRIKERFKDKILKLANNQKYQIIGVPFYDYEDENRFKQQFQEVLSR